MTGVYKRGPRYWVSYSGPRGEVIRESTMQADPDVAMAFRESRRAEVAAGTWRRLASVRRRRLGVRHVYAISAT